MDTWVTLIGCPVHSWLGDLFFCFLVQYPKRASKRRNKEKEEDLTGGESPFADKGLDHWCVQVNVGFNVFILFMV